MKFTNPTDQTIDLIVKGEPKDGVPPTDHILPGETKDVAVDPGSVQIRTMIDFGALVPEGGKAAKPAKE